MLGYLGIPQPADLQIKSPGLSVQADETSEDWVNRVHEHLRALEVPTVA